MRNLAAYFLLLAFGLAILPPESFHRHESELTVCDESELHYSDHSFDCDLADFFLPNLIQEVNEEISPKEYFFPQLHPFWIDAYKITTHAAFRGRAPPELA